MTFDDADLNEIELDNFSEPVLRISIGMELFFTRPFRPHASAVLEVWERLRAWRGDVFTWGRLAGSARSRKMKGGAKLIASWLDGSKDYGRYCRFMAHSGEWEMMGGDAFDLEGDGCEIHTIVNAETAAS